MGWLDSGGGPAYADQSTVSAPTVDQAVAPAADATPTSACPELAGDWAGTLQGTTTGLFQFTVSGTMSITLGQDPAGQAGDYLVTGGQMVAYAKGLEAFPFKYQITGKVSCGVLTAQNSVNIFGVQSAGSCNCTFTEAGCKGSWDGQTADGSSKGSGTFEVKRKQ